MNDLLIELRQLDINQAGSWPVAFKVGALAILFIAIIVAGHFLVSQEQIETLERIRVIDAARAIIERSGYDATIKTDPSKPTGPYNRVADNTLAREMLGWSPRVAFYESLEQTIQWYGENHDVDEVRSGLQRRLLER